MPSADLMLRLLLAGGLGSVLGLERELRRSPAGLRTHILIALGAALFTLVSIEIAGGTPDRIAAARITADARVVASCARYLRFATNVRSPASARSIPATRWMSTDPSPSRRHAKRSAMLCSFNRLWTI